MNWTKFNVFIIKDKNKDLEPIHSNLPKHEIMVFYFPFRYLAFKLVFQYWGYL